MQTRARVDAICCCFFLLCARFPVSVFSTCVSQREHIKAHALAQVDRTQKNTFMVAEPFADAEGLFLSVAMSAELTHQRLGVAEGVIRELQEHLQRVSAGHQAAHEALPTIHQETSLLRSQIDTVSRIRLVEPKVNLDKGLRWSSALSAETCEEECRMLDAADLRIELSRLQCDDSNGPRVATCLRFHD